MERYLELDSNFLERIEVLKMVMAMGFRELTEDEAALWSMEDSDRDTDLDRVINDLADVIVMRCDPPFPPDSCLVVASRRSVQIIENRLDRLGWASASADEVTELRNCLERGKAEYWKSLEPDQQERWMAQEVAGWEAEKRRFEENRRYRASLLPEDREREFKRRDEAALALLSPEEREEELQRRRRIHFGTLGMPIGTAITFIPTGQSHKVASGNGRPENGGILLLVPGEGLWSIRYLTRRLMAEKFEEDSDEWAFWEFEGESLRSRFRRRFPDL